MCGDHSDVLSSDRRALHGPEENSRKGESWKLASSGVLGLLLGIHSNVSVPCVLTSLSQVVNYSQL